MSSLGKLIVKGWAFQADMAAFRDLQYCKTDLIAAKGIVFCKYTKASAALRALEAVNATGMVPTCSFPRTLCTRVTECNAVCF